MKCPNCGVELADSSKKCSQCGTEVLNDFNYNNMEKELLNTVLEDENMISITPETSSETPSETLSKTSSGQEDDSEKALEEEPEEVKKQYGKLGVSLLAAAAVFAGLQFGIQSFSAEEYTYSEAESNYQNCLSAIAKEDYREALKSADLLLAKDEDNLEYLSLKNIICRSTKDNKAQTSVLKQIIAADPDNYPAYEQLLELYLEDSDQSKIAELAADAPNSVISSMIKESMVTAPYLELTPGVYNTGQLLEISSEQGHAIYYTLDGSSPKKKGIPYIEPIPLEQGQRYTVTAVCKNERGIYGDEVSGEYQIGISIGMQ